MIKREDKFRVNVIACHETHLINIVLKIATVATATVPSYVVTRDKRLQFNRSHWRPAVNGDVTFIHFPTLTQWMLGNVSNGIK